MAPEVILGQGADEKSDQFSFAVSLFQGLYGCLPFAGRTLREISDAIHAGRMADGHGHSVPGWLRKALTRGLQAHPTRRYPSMKDMLAVLERRDPASVRKRWAVYVTSAAAVVVVGFLGAATLANRSAHVCQGAEQNLAGVWDEGRRRAVQASLLDTGLTYAPETWTRVRETLDTYVNGWVAMHTEACQATHVRGEQSGELLDLRMRCLKDRLGEVKALVDVLAHADKEVLPKAVPAVDSLLALSTCSDVESLQSAVAPPKDPLVRQQVEQFREQLEKVRALERTGKYADGMALVEHLEKQVRPVAYLPLIAEVLHLKGVLLIQRARYPESVEALEEADSTAALVKHAQVAAMAQRELVNAVGYHLQRIDEALVRARSAEVFLRQTGLFDKMGDRLLSAVGLVHLRKAAFGKSIDYQKRALELCTTQVPVEQCHTIMLRLGAVYMAAGRLQEAQAIQLETLRITEKVLGSSHPELGKAMNNYGLLMMEMARYDESLEWFHRAHRICEQAFDKDHPQLSDITNNIGNVHWWRMEFQEALSSHQKALDIRLKVFGAEHNSVANSHQNLGTDYLSLRNVELSRMHLQRAIDLKTRLLGPDNPQTLACIMERGRLMLVENNVEQAQVELDKVIALLTKANGPTHLSVYDALLYRAEVALQRHDPATARGLLERSLEIQERNHLENRFTIQTHMNLAKALWATPETRIKALEHAHKAGEMLARFNGNKAPLLRELESWMEQHKL